MIVENMDEAEAVLDLAEELSDHTTNRGEPFRDITVQSRCRLARPLIRARSEVSKLDDIDSAPDTVIEEIVRNKTRAYYNAGYLGVPVREVEHIWRSVVFDDPPPCDYDKVI